MEDNLCTVRMTSDARQSQRGRRFLSKLDDAVKRGFDFTAAALGVILLTPVLVVIAVAILLESRGPIIYRGTRTGRYGNPFKILKFRTMVPNAELLGGTTTGKEDPRLTRIGKHLRRFKLDELPQLINVLKGDMSLVGPRPEVDEYTALYDEDEKRILSVRPGITDFASLQFVNLAEIVGTEDVDRKYKDFVRPQKNRLRLKYVDERSLWVDLKILFKTVLVLMRRALGIHHA
jgi:lipopolysaccharide/colanic/teichoic acid biosynthesis glycosyltransferase